MPKTGPTDTGPADILPSLPSLALEEALRQLAAMSEALWPLHDALLMQRDARMVAPEAEVLAMAQSHLKDVEKQLRQLSDCLADVLDLRAARQDADAVAQQTYTPEGVTAVRGRLAQADAHLSRLYSHLQALCRDIAEPLRQEAQLVRPDALADVPPLWSASGDVYLEYMLSDSHPLFDMQGTNTLATQTALSWRVSAGQAVDETALDEPDTHNWLDYSHKWMDHQSLLTHDVLEHQYGHNTRLGVAALLETGIVHVHVKTVRSYAYDLYVGRFVAADEA